MIDDIQVGNGRTGTFFSFEEAGIEPDMICLSKSLGGGLPFAVLLMKPELDQWKPGEHTGTFRGNNLAFVAATELMKKYWSNTDFSREIMKKADILDDGLREIYEESSPFVRDCRGRGMVRGIEFSRDNNVAGDVSTRCFESGLVAEVCGSDNHVLKLLPPLTISLEHLREGLGILKTSIEEIRVPHDCTHA